MESDITVSSDLLRRVAVFVSARIISAGAGIRQDNKNDTIVTIVPLGAFKRGFK